MTSIIGKRKGMSLGASLFTAAGQLITSSAAGVASVLSVGSSGQFLTTDGSTVSWGNLPVYQRVVTVASDVTHAQSDTSLSNVTGLAVPVTSSSTEIWLFEAFLLVNGASAAQDLKLGFTVPASTTMKWGVVGSSANMAGFSSVAVGSTPTAILAASDTLSVGTLGATGTGASIAGVIFAGGTSGNVQLQFAQNTSTAADLIIQKGSALRYTRLAT